MKAASLLRHIWVGCFICCLFLAATGVAYASAANGKETVKPAPEASVKQDLVQQVDPVKKKSESVTATKDNLGVKTQPKHGEVKREEATSNFFSFSFLYYLFYKSNLVETTNNTLRNSINSFISSLFD